MTEKFLKDINSCFPKCLQAYSEEEVITLLKLITEYIKRKKCPIDFETKNCLGPTRDPINDIGAFLMLNESYSKTTFEKIDDFLLMYFAYLDGTISKETFGLIELGSRYYIYLTDSLPKTIEDTIIVEGKYLTAEKITVFLFSPELEKDLKLGNYRIEFSEKIKGLVVHEDTHRQQDLKSNGKFRKGYKDVQITISEEDLEKIKTEARKYYNQKIEADAFGRQTGYLLKSRFPNTDPQILVDWISSGKVPNFLGQTYLNIFKNPEFADKETRAKFFRAAYDYILENEVVAE